MKKEVITITFGDAAENHFGMEQIGTINQKGFSLSNLIHASQFFEQIGVKSEIIELHNLLSKDDLPEGIQLSTAFILVVKNGLKFLLQQNQKTVEDLHKQLTNFQWDSKFYDARRQKVLNKHARKNVCFAQKAQQADFQNKKGTIIPWKDVPILESIRKNLNKIMGTVVEFQAEGNLYHDGGVKNTGVGYHGDSQRKMVIAIRTGSNSMPLHYQWFLKSKPVGKNFSVDIAPGDFYVMSEKAVGTDWKKKSILTLRHASGAKKFIQI